MKKLRAPLLIKVTLICAAVCLFAQETTIRVDVRLVRIIATVKDAAGQLTGAPARSYIL